MAPNWWESSQRRASWAVSSSRASPWARVPVSVSRMWACAVESRTFCGAAVAGDGDGPLGFGQVPGAAVGERELLLADRPILGLAEVFELAPGPCHDAGSVVVLAVLAQGGADPQPGARPVPPAQALIVGQPRIAPGCRRARFGNGAPAGAQLARACVRQGWRAVSGTWHAPGWRAGGLLWRWPAIAVREGRGRHRGGSPGGRRQWLSRWRGRR
jgi:hypothetical protein